MSTCTKKGENSGDYGQLKATLYWSAGVAESGQECSPLLSVRTKSAASTYYVQWIINVMANIAKHMLEEVCNGFDVLSNFMLCRVWILRGKQKPVSFTPLKYLYNLLCTLVLHPTPRMMLSACQQNNILNYCFKKKNARNLRLLVWKTIDVFDPWAVTYCASAPK